MRREAGPKATAHENHRYGIGVARAGRSRNCGDPVEDSRLHTVDDMPRPARGVRILIWQEA